MNFRADELSLHSCDGVVERFVGDVGVDLRLPEVGVAQKLGYDVDAIAGFAERRGKGVPEVVHPEVRQSRGDGGAPKGDGESFGGELPNDARVGLGAGEARR